MMTALQELLNVIPTAEEIKQYIFENQADTKMLDEWLWERIYKDKNWIELEKQQIIDAYHINPNESKWKNEGIKYYNETYNNLNK